jgi:anti-anti-sigma factor
MRPGTRLASPEACDVHDHLTWVFEDDADFVAAARTFLDEGAARGERLIYGAARPVGELAAELADVCCRDRMIESGMLVVVDVRDLAGLTDAEREDLFVASVDAADAAGYTGLRVAVDTTEMNGPRFDHVRQGGWERFSDRLIVDRAVTALCGLDRTAVGDESVARMTALHPAVHGREPVAPFAVYATAGGAAISGEIDFSAGPALATALGYDEPAPGEFVLDVSGVRFIDGRGLAALGERADRLAEAGSTLVVEGASPVVARLWHLCGLADHPSALLRRAVPA